MAASAVAIWFGYIALFQQCSATRPKCAAGSRPNLLNQQPRNDRVFRQVRELVAVAHISIRRRDLYRSDSPGPMG